MEKDSFDEKVQESLKLIMQIQNGEIKDEKIIKQCLKGILDAITKQKTSVNINTFFLHLSKTIQQLVNQFHSTEQQELLTPLITEYQSWIDENKFQYCSLSEIKRFIKSCKKNQNYSNLFLSAKLIVTLSEMNEYGSVDTLNQSIDTTDTLLDSKVKGYSFVPGATPSYDLSQAKETVKLGLQKLKNS